MPGKAKTQGECSEYISFLEEIFSRSSDTARNAIWKAEEETIIENKKKAGRSLTETEKKSNMEEVQKPKVEETDKGATNKQQVAKPTPERAQNEVKAVIRELQEII